MPRPLARREAGSAHHGPMAESTSPQRPHAPRRPARSTASDAPAAGRAGRSPHRSATAGGARPTAARPARSLSFGGLTISVRMLGVAVMAALLAVMLVPSIYQWWQQEQDYRDITARVAAAQARNEDMRQQLELWKDPDYIDSQARARLGYVKPGETQYAVTDPGEDHQAPAVSAAASGPDRPWVQLFVASLTEADSPGE